MLDRELRVRSIDWYWREIDETEAKIKAVQHGDTSHTLGDLERYLDSMYKGLDLNN